MIAAEGNCERANCFELGSFFRISRSDQDRLLVDSSDGQDSRLRRIYNRTELLNSKHAEVGNGEGSHLSVVKYN